MKPPLIIFSGESNSGGYAQNTSATPAELAPRPNVQILNNNTLRFEPLDIGTNNLIGHLSGNAEFNAQSVHGWELELANQSAQFGPRTYLCKTGHGGSVISQWARNSPIPGKPYYAKFLERINAIKSLSASDLSIYNPVLWYTQGINDALVGTNLATWSAATIAHFTKIRLEVPNIPILFTNVTPSYPAYTAEIIRITGAVPNCHYIPTNGASLRDVNHWDYLGMKLISNRLIEKTLQIFDEQSFSEVLDSPPQPFSGLTFGLTRSVVEISMPGLREASKAKRLQ